MARPTTLAAFLVTTAVAIPAGWRVLDADIQTDGKRVRPMQQSFIVDGARVTLDVDRGLAITGESVTAKLVAYSDTPKQVVVDMTVLQSKSTENERVEPPDLPIDHERLTLEAAPEGGKPVLTKIKLGTNPGRPAMVDNFKIYVGAHGKKLPKSEYNGGVDATAGIEAGEAAAVAIHSWSGDNLKISMEPEGRLIAGASFNIKVRVKNTSGRKLSNPPWVSLTTELGGPGWAESDAAFEVSSAEDEELPENTDWKRGEVSERTFVVVPKTTTLKQITLVASAFVSDDGPGPTQAGARDAKTFTFESEPTPAVAVK
jgi:hypothetical protein